MSYSARQKKGDMEALLPFEEIWEGAVRSRARRKGRRQREREIQSLGLFLWHGAEVNAPVNHTFKDRWPL